MAAYASLISLKHTIYGLLRNHPRISHVPSNWKILGFACYETTSLQQVLERSNDRIRSRSSWERLDALEGEIRDCANKLEDALEFHELNSQEEEEIWQEITSFGETVKKMKKDYDEELSREDEDDDGDAAIIASSDIDSTVEMVGRCKIFNDIRQILLRRMRPDDLWLFAFWGQAGSGRTVIPRAIYEDEGELQFFECRAWVTIGGTKLELKAVLMNIIAQVDDIINNPVAAKYDEFSDEKYLSEYLYRILEHRRYMIVLDDVDDVDLVNYLKQSSFPDRSNGSIVFLTTTSREVARQAEKFYKLRWPATYFVEASMFSMQRVFFRNKPMTAEFEFAAKNIIQNCRCRRISVAKTMLFLMKTEKTVEQWSRIAADQQNPIFMIADEISETIKIEIEMQCCSREVVHYMSEWVRLPKLAESVKMKVHPERFFSRMQIISLYGMAGIGKSALARKVSKDESVLSRFDHHVWITLGPKYQTQEILIDILAQIYPHHIHRLHQKGDDKLVRDLCVQLSSKRCLIVLDDLCSQEPLLHLKHLFPDIKGTILVTTRLPKVAKFGRDDSDFEIQLLDGEDSWRLLHQKVFAGGWCPPELEKAGRKIAKSVTVFLS